MQRQNSKGSEKGPPTPVEEHALGYTDEPEVPRWKRLLKNAGAADNDTQRGMQSRHLTMIGTCLCSVVEWLTDTFYCSYRWHDRNWHLPKHRSSTHLS